MATMRETAKEAVPVSKDLVAGRRCHCLFAVKEQPFLRRTHVKSTIEELDSDGDVMVVGPTVSMSVSWKELDAIKSEGLQSIFDTALRNAVRDYMRLHPAEKNEASRTTIFGEPVPVPPMKGRKSRRIQKTVLPPDNPVVTMPPVADPNAIHSLLPGEMVRKYKNDNFCTEAMAVKDVAFQQVPNIGFLINYRFEADLDTYFIEYLKKEHVLGRGPLPMTPIPSFTPARTHDPARPESEVEIVEVRSGYRGTLRAQYVVRRPAMQQALPMHTPALPFLCGTCNRSFATSEELKAHRAKHTLGDVVPSQKEEVRVNPARKSRKGINLGDK
jgi:hypothetical protein